MYRRYTYILTTIVNRRKPNGQEGMVTCNLSMAENGSMLYSATSGIIIKLN